MRKAAPAPNAPPIPSARNTARARSSKAAPCAKTNQTLHLSQNTLAEGAKPVRTGLDNAIGRPRIISALQGAWAKPFRNGLAVTPPAPQAPQSGPTSGPLAPPSGGWPRQNKTPAPV